MTIDGSQCESFDAFRKSFAYGSRTDLNFKFLSGLSEDDAAQFFQGLLWKLGGSFDNGEFNRVLEHVQEWQVRAYSKGGRWTYDDGPFVPLRKPLSESRLALLTSSGHFVAGDDPEPFGVKNMTQEEAMDRIGEFLKTEPTLSSIPTDTPRENLRVRHGGYDIRGAQSDPNVAFPMERLLELKRDEVIGELVPHAFSFVGACSQLLLLKDTVPEWVKLFKQQRIDAIVLVPA